MKPPALDLHWQLLPYQPQRSKHPLHFDIAFPIDEIRFKDYPVPNRPLTSADLDKPAANDKMTKMVIQFKNFPDWEIFIKRDEGIRCRDVFESIYSNFNIPLTPLEERTLIHPANRKLCEEAFRLRCKLAAGLTVVEKSLGFKRVDVLLHSTLFKGLTQPKSGGDWVLNLG
ncbi:hypothetical protein BJ138DRAFT_89650 [Hygrophoropsis aurantiaca]|uniref:Uncharacterized protein n=1 Tax=Hygrophoropsis aurantiaca TaxID=72124 RepID=A0ACB8AQA3_9AGAM|nr:hypothetical protein BJ138DRAFT_89650 [Hygrophoropsis aurantiaca]